ncbi:UNVERIFIED_ORG: hypothetical protein [Escherichia phage CMSTMSU]
MLVAEVIAPEALTPARVDVPVTFSVVAFAVVAVTVVILASVLESLGRTLLTVPSELITAPVLVRDLTATSAALRSTVPATTRSPPMLAPSVVVRDLASISVVLRSIARGNSSSYR